MFKDRVEIAKNIVEIIAIIGAAVWGYYTFGVKEKPSLEHRLKVESELVWKEIPGVDACEAELGVSLENIGTSAFEISKVRLRAWEFPALMPDSNEFAKYLDVDAVQKEATLFFEKVYDADSVQEEKLPGPFLARYAPGNSWEHAYQFIIRRVPGKWVFFKVDFYEKGDESVVKDGAYHWSAVCGGKSEKNGSGND